MDFVPHDQILSYEEMLRLVALSVKAGIRKVRLTGGEPLVRKGFIPFLEKLSAIEDLREISLTTNGVLLKEFAEDIRRCGICRVNVSLDSLDPEKFARITGRDYLHRVLEGIGEAQRLGFNPIKINVVAMRGINDDEILDFGRLTIASVRGSPSGQVDVRERNGLDLVRECIGSAARIDDEPVRLGPQVEQIPEKVNIRHPVGFPDGVARSAGDMSACEIHGRIAPFPRALAQNRQPLDIGYRARRGSCQSGPARPSNGRALVFSPQRRYYS